MCVENALEEFRSPKILENQLPENQLHENIRPYLRYIYTSVSDV